MADLGGRRCGNTYRQVLRAILWASEHENQRIAFIVHNAPMVEEVMHMARAITTPLRGFAVLNWTARHIRFQNGSAIEVKTPPHIERMVGQRWTVFEDHWVQEEALLSERDRDILEALKDGPTR